MLITKRDHIKQKKAYPTDKESVFAATVPTWEAVYVAFAAFSLRLGRSVSVASGAGTVDRCHHGAGSGVLATQSPALVKAVLSLGAAASLPPVGEGLLHLGRLVGGPFRPLVPGDPLCLHLRPGKLHRCACHGRRDELLPRRCSSSSVVPCAASSASH
jgi:hypothetical protein